MEFTNTTFNLFHILSNNLGRLVLAKNSFLNETEFDLLWAYQRIVFEFIHGTLCAHIITKASFLS